MHSLARPQLGRTLRPRKQQPKLVVARVLCVNSAAVHPVRRRQRANHKTCVCYSLAVAHVEVGKSKSESLKPMPRAMENVADDPNLRNPLKRMERLSPGWCGIILELDGVVVEDTQELQARAWMQVADEIGARKPLGYILRKAIGLRDEAVISRIFGWTSIPELVTRIAKRKAELVRELTGGLEPVELAGTRHFVQMCKSNNVPVGLACAVPKAAVMQVLEKLEMKGLFDTVITAEDNSSPETEPYYMYAAQDIQRPPMRCAVVGSSNRSIEAAHELGMKAIIVTAGKPAYDFGGADLVVKTLTQLSFMNLKKLFGTEDLVAPQAQPETQEDADKN